MSIMDDMLAGTKAAEPEKNFVGRAWEDIKTTAGNYLTGAKQGFEEMVREGDKLAETNPLALTGTPMADGTTNAPAPEQTDDQKQDLAVYQQASDTFNKETVAPVAMTVGGILAPELTMAAATGYLAKEGYDKTGTIEGAAREATYGPVVDWYKQDDLGQQLYDRPISTTVSGILGLGQAIFPVGFALKGARNISRNGKRAEPVGEERTVGAEKYTNAEEKIPQQDVTAQNPVSDKSIPVDRDVVAQNIHDAMLDGVETPKYEKTGNQYSYVYDSVSKKLRESGLDEVEADANASLAAAFADTMSSRSKGFDAQKWADNLSVRATESGEGMYSQYIGKNAETADLLGLSKAETLLSKGVDNETIRQQTGWNQGMDGKWRFEIDDSDAKVINRDLKADENAVAAAYAQARREKNAETKADMMAKADALYDAYEKNSIPILKNILDHPALYKAYPWIGRIKVVKTNLPKNEMGGYDPSINTIKLNSSLTPSEMRSTILHEVQHAIQEQENFARGSSPTRESRLYNVKGKAAFERYQRSAGEIEARDTADRGNMTAEQRRNVVPDLRDDAIISYGGNEYGYVMSGRVAGSFTPKDAAGIIEFYTGRNKSTPPHEMAHAFFDTFAKVSKMEGAPAEIRADWATLNKWIGIDWDKATDAQKAAAHEKFADGFVDYLKEGKAPSTSLQRTFERLKVWLEELYGKASVKDGLSDEARAVMDRMLSVDKDNAAIPHEGEQASLGKYTPIEPAKPAESSNVTRKEIVDDINNLVQSRTGRLGNQEFAGVHKADQGVIRAREYGDFDTYAHEIGHYVDKQLGVNGHDAELIKAADNEWTGAGTYEKYTPEQRRAEGVAEFMRQYLLNPETAKENFPGYYDSFIKALAGDEKLGKSLDSIGENMRRWYAQSPEARGRGVMSFAGDSKPTIKDRIKQVGSKLYEMFIDDKTALKDMTKSIEKAIDHKLPYEQNPYQRARMAQNAALARAEMMVNDEIPSLVQDTLNKLYNGKIKHAVTMREILDQLKPSGLNKTYPKYLKDNNFKNWQEAFSTFLTAKRQIELEGIHPEYKGPMSKADAAAIAKNAPKEFEELAQKFYDYNDNLLSIAEDGGLISQETVKLLREKYKNYSPMSRDFSDEGAMTDALGSSKKIGGVGNPLKKITEEGSGRSVVDPLENTIKNTYTLLNAVERNKVANVFVDVSNEFADIGRFIERVEGNTGDPKKSIFTVMVDGEKQAFQTTPEFYRAIMSMNQQSANAFMSLLRPFAKALRIGATTSPGFVVKNLIRDTVTAGIYTETGFKPVLDTVRGAAALIKDKPLAYEFKASGAPLSALVGMDRAELGGILDKMGGGTSWHNIKPVQIVDGIIEGARKVSEMSESATRMGEYSRARAKGVGIEEAGLLAKDITIDFSRSGSVGRIINQGVPFFNAVLQGGDRLVRALHDNPTRTLGALTRYITLPSVLLWSINHDEDWYKELSNDVKNSSWLIKSGDTILRIPKPFEPGILFGSAIERELDRMYNEDPYTVKQFLKYTLDGFTPGIMPTLAGPIVEWMTNYNFFTNKSVVGRKEQGLPDEEQYTPYTSELAKKTGKATGLSPMKIDNTIAGYTASAGQFVVGLLDNLIGNKAELPAKTISELPGISGLTYTPFKNPRSVELFYEKLDDANKEQNAYGEKGNVPADLKKLRKAGEKIGKLHKTNREITVSNKSPEEKRRLIDENNAKILAIAKQHI